MADDEHSGVGAGTQPDGGRRMVDDEHPGAHGQVVRVISADTVVHPWIK